MTDNIFFDLYFIQNNFENMLSQVFIGCAKRFGFLKSKAITPLRLYPEMKKARDEGKILS